MILYDARLLRVAIIEFVSTHGSKADIYQLLNEQITASVSELRLVLKEMQQEELLDLYYAGNTSCDRYGFRPLVEVKLQL